jgi:hypothetical protein
MPVKISELTAATTPTGTELVEVVQGGTNKRTTIDAIALKSKTLAELNTQVSDATIAQTGATQTFTGAQQTGVTTLTSASPILIDAAANNSFVVTLDAARELDNPTNLAAGMSWTVRVIQDGTGTWALTFDTYYEFGDDNSAPDTSADAATKERLLTFYAITSTRVLCVDAVGVY